MGYDTANSQRLLWVAAASYEERIASLLDAHGDNPEATVQRISAASCYQKAGDPSRATNLFRAALAGPLRAVTRQQVEDMLSECLALLTQAAPAKKPGDAWEPVDRRRARAGQRR